MTSFLYTKSATMDFLELTQKRFSARSYKSDPVEQEKINYLLECARRAPSAVNFQPWHFLVIKSEEQRKKVQACYPRDWFANAPVYIIVCVDKSQAWKRKTDDKSHADIDAAIAAEHICLAATSIGLGSCWVCNFDPHLFQHHFRLTGASYPVAIIPIGYIKEQPENFSGRKELKEITTEL